MQMTSNEQVFFAFGFGFSLSLQFSFVHCWKAFPAFSAAQQVQDVAFHWPEEEEHCMGMSISVCGFACFKIVNAAEC